MTRHPRNDRGVLLRGFEDAVDHLGIGDGASGVVHSDVRDAWVDGLER